MLSTRRYHVTHRILSLLFEMSKTTSRVPTIKSNLRLFHLFTPPNKCFFFFFFNDPAPPEISTLPLHAPLPILCLAWLPLGFAFFADRFRASRACFLAFGFLWLLFLPNSPYLVTDLVHLKPQHRKPNVRKHARDRKSTRLNSSH